MRKYKEVQGSGVDERQQHSAQRACSEADVTSPHSSVGAAALREAREPSVESSSSISPRSFSSCSTKKSAKEQGKEDGGGDARLQRTTQPAQGRVPVTSSQASVGVEEASASSWTAVSASPASAHACIPCEKASPVKGVSTF